MANTTLGAGTAAVPKSLLARFFGIITSPRATFEAIVAHPKWLGMLALGCLLTAVIMGGFMLTRVGQDAWLDMMLNNPARPVPEQQAQMFEKMAPYLGYITAAQMVVFFPLMLALLSGILYAVFNAALGGNATFKQLFAVVVHAWAPIGLLSMLFTVPLIYARGTMSSASNLGVLLPMLPEGSFLAKFAGMIELFLVWQLFVLAMGFSGLYRRKTQPIAITLFGVYAVIAVV